jgi:membrane-associated phospholipid phosphatase
MLAATPIDGGHYFVDVFAGLGVAAAAIWAACRISRGLAARETRGVVENPGFAPARA